VNNGNQVATHIYCQIPDGTPRDADTPVNLDV
jgi:hypothetical protein